MQAMTNSDLMERPTADGIWDYIDEKCYLFTHGTKTVNLSNIALPNLNINQLAEILRDLKNTEDKRGGPEILLKIIEDGDGVILTSQLTTLVISENESDHTEKNARVEAKKICHIGTKHVPQYENDSC